MAQPANDLLNRHAVFGQGENRRIDLLPPLITFVLQAFCGGEQVRIDRRCADRGADLAHRCAHRIEKGPTGILHQMPTIGDLGRVRKCPGNSFTVSATSVAGDNGNLLMPFKPSGRGRGLTIGQQGHRPTSFEIADNRSIAVVAPPCPVINPDDIQRLAG
jgi:hypothetical protein